MTTPLLLTGGSSNDPSFNQPLLPALLAAINNTVAHSQITIAVSFIRHSGWRLLHTIRRHRRHETFCAAEGSG